MSYRNWFPFVLLAICLTADVAAGADGSAGTKSSFRDLPITSDDREHWSYQPIQSPDPPAVRQTDWPRTAIDPFILQRLEEAELAPAPRADRATLLRRVKFDLLGLPPTPEEIATFLSDPAPDPYPRLVDRLLGSPAYGERWAQHWLDLARFAETDGFEHDKVRQDAWRYRQWVIDAFNEDLPYDRFVRLQLTGDLSDDPADAIATMFCTAGPDMPDINEQDLRRHDKLNEMTSTVGAVLLGLQMHCAQCHDHKFDPISQADFFRLRGIFEAAIPEMKRDRPVHVLVMQTEPVSPFLYLRGDVGRPGPVLQPRPPRIASTPQAYQRFDGTQPRQALADWLFCDENHLTARVMANRIWQHHFGQSLCGNPSDFGVVAAGPSHPQLLDWLATELRRGGWSIKRLHRLILLSSTYQQASRPASSGENQTASAGADADADNQLYSHFPRRRLEGEAIRDALLAVSGQLNRRYGGASVMPPLPPELLATLLRGQWKTSPKEADHARRSIYVFARRNLRYPLFDVFDRPSAGASCPQRDRSTTAIQSLQLLNSEVAVQAARHLRDRLLAWQADLEADGSGDRQASCARLTKRLFLLTLGRAASPSETERVTDLLCSSQMPPEESLLAACLALLNTNEFVYFD